ncbi:hypothetical protein, partial [Pandoraea cepalis]|uniref:hypothetical protein n=1 Tax=Pandoraea cepalis TaxID=2508294 RepID=UPI001C2D417C
NSITVWRRQSQKKNLTQCPGLVDHYNLACPVRDAVAIRFVKQVPQTGSEYQFNSVTRALHSDSSSPERDLPDMDRKSDQLLPEFDISLQDWMMDYAGEVVAQLEATAACVQSGNATD